MTTTRIPAGPDDKYNSNQDLLEWMGQQFHKFGDIYKASVYGSNVYVTRNPQHAYHVLVENWQNYVKGQFIKRIAFLLGNGLMVSEGELWKRQRRMIQPAFHGKAVDALTGLIATANFALVKKWEQAAHKNDNVNVTRDVSAMILEVVLSSIFGKDYKQVEPHFKILSEEPSRNLKFAKAFRSLGKVILEVADQRRKQSSHSTDVFGMLMEARDESGEPMPDRQLIDEILTLIVAGHETTASTLNWTWYLISQSPDVEQKLSDELNVIGSEHRSSGNLAKYVYARQVLDESLRLYPAGWLMTRKALEDDRLGDYSVPAGTEVYISPYFVQRNPDLWEEPDRFNPDRFSPDQVQNRHRLAMFPFSAGPRNCIGESLARLEMLIHLTIIARRLSLQYVQTAHIEFDAGVNLRSKHDFVMRPVLKAMAKC